MDRWQIKSVPILNIVCLMFIPKDNQIDDIFHNYDKLMIFLLFIPGKVWSVMLRPRYGVPIEAWVNRSLSTIYRFISLIKLRCIKSVYLSPSLHDKSRMWQALCNPVWLRGPLNLTRCLPKYSELYLWSKPKRVIFGTHAPILHTGYYIQYNMIWFSMIVVTWSHEPLWVNKIKIINTALVTYKIT